MYLKLLFNIPSLLFDMKRDECETFHPSCLTWRGMWNISSLLPDMKRDECETFHPSCLTWRGMNVKHFIPLAWHEEGWMWNISCLLLDMKRDECETFHPSCLTWRGMKCFTKVSNTSQVSMTFTFRCSFWTYRHTASFQKRLEKKDLSLIN